MHSLLLDSQQGEGVGRESEEVGGEGRVRGWGGMSEEVGREG